MEKVIKFTIIILLALSLAGCSHQIREPDELEMIRVIGIDGLEKGCTVTVCTGQPADGGKPTVRTGQGLTIDGALKNLKSASSNRIPFYSHTQYIVIGESLANRGIGEVLDYIARSGEMRIGTGIVIAKGSAGELIGETAVEDGSVFSNLTNIEEQSPAAGSGVMLTALDTASALLRQSCGAAMAVELTGEDEKTVVPCGFALLINNRLAGYLPTEDSLGGLILTDNAENVNISAEVNGSPAAFDVSGFDIEFEPLFSGNSMESLNISVKTQAFLSEMGGKFDPTDKAQKKIAEQSVSAVMCDSIVNAIRDTQAVGGDCFGIGQRARMEDPADFDKISGDWSDIYPDLPINITVSVTLTGSYDMDRGLFGD